MADGTAFGASFNKEVMDRLMDEPEEDLAPDEPEASVIEAPPETPEIELAPDSEPEPEPEEEVEEATEAEEEPEEVSAETPEPLILGRYKSTDDLVNAYQEVRGLQQRTAEQVSEKDSEIEEYKALLAQAAQALQAQQGPAQPDPQLVAWAEQQGIDPANLPVLMQLADQAAAAKVAPMQQQLEKAKAEQQAQAEYNAQVGAIQAFRSKHPEVTPNSEEDNRHAEVFKAMQEDPQIQLQWNEDTLEIALEASQDPDLYAIIRANPALIDTDEGLDYARWQATLKKGTQTAQTQAQKKQSKAQRQAAARKAHVETGSTAPTGSVTEEDPYDIAVAQATAERKSAFF